MNCLAFDVYGTLIDTRAIENQLQVFCADKAALFSETWRNKQLEYSFRRGLMGQYRDFSVCTRDALVYTGLKLGVALSNAQQEKLMQDYLFLPAFDDVTACLETLKNNGYNLYALSNGSKSTVEQLLNHANIRQYFSQLISVEEINTFKPDPRVYQHFLDVTAATGEGNWLISANPFDVIGAITAGVKGLWLQRDENMVFDPWGIAPSCKVATLAELPEALQKHIENGIDN